MKLNTALWITAITSTILNVLGFMLLTTMHAGGEPPFLPLYTFAWQNETLIQVVFTVFGFIAPAAWLTLLALKLKKSAKEQPKVEFSKNYKFNQMRRLALIIAAIPGLVLGSFAIATLISLLGPSADMVAGIFVVISLSSIFPGIMAMIALLVIALSTLFKKTIDPEAERPKPHLLQIWLAVITTAMPATAMILTWLNAFKPCDTGCNIFQDPVVAIAEISYFVMWIALGIVWIKSKQAKPIA